MCWFIHIMLNYIDLVYPIYECINYSASYSSSSNKINDFFTYCANKARTVFNITLAFTNGSKTLILIFCYDSKKF